MAEETIVGDYPILASGQLRHGMIALSGTDHSVRYRFKVDADFYAIRLNLQNATSDLDLTVTDSAGNDLWTRNTPSWNESLLLYRMGSPSLEDGEYVVKVSFSGDYRPSSRGSLLAAIDFDLDFKQVRVDHYEALALGQMRHDSLDPDSGMQKAYKILVPAGTTQVRIDIFGSQTDTDIYGQARLAFSDPRLAEFAAQTWRSRESLLIPIPKASPLKAGASGVDAPVPVYVMILSEMDDVPTPFQLIASIGSAVPPGLQALPPLELLHSGVSPGGLTAAVAATVEIITESGGGSGCVISPDGWILTNYHVIRGNGGTAAQRVSVGFTQDIHLVPDTQFWAELEAFDASRDLALLQIKTGFYQQPIPAGYRFPFMQIATSSNLHIAEALYFTGYPTIGGMGNRATITCTEGMVSGFQNRNGISYIKSAAVISPGNSGGAALDSSGGLVGIPTMVVGSETSQLAYISSIETVPVAWLKLIETNSNHLDRNAQP